MELVFDAWKDGDWIGSSGRPRHSLEYSLGKGGVDERLSQEVELRVCLRVRREDEKIAREDVEELSEWMKKLVVVEIA